MSFIKILKVTVISNILIAGVILTLHTLATPLPPKYDFRKTVVKVKGITGHGSGSIIESIDNKSLILTNRHVCNGVTLTFAERRKLQELAKEAFICIFGATPQCIQAQKNYANFKKSINTIGREVSIIFNNLDLEPITGKIAKVSKYTDLCLVEIPKGGLPAIKISKRRARPGDHVTALGNPLNMTNHQTDGFVGDDMEYQGNVYQHITAEFYAGSSGSPTVNDAGELVGVNTLGTNVSTQGYMIPLEDVILFLIDNTFELQVNRGLEGV